MTTRELAARVAELERRIVAAEREIATLRCRPLLTDRPARYPPSITDDPTYPGTTWWGTGTGSVPVVDYDWTKVKWVTISTKPTASGVVDSQPAT